MVTEMVDKKLAVQFEKSLIKLDMLLEQGIVGDNLFSTALNQICDGRCFMKWRDMWNQCYIDTGAVFNGNLTLFNIKGGAA